MPLHYTDADMFRFWTNVKPFGACLLWAGAPNVRWGYGQFNCSCGKKHRPHRMALELRLGRPLGPGMLACHDCPGGDNRLCVLHLWEGTYTDNLLDAIRKGRTHAPRGPAGERHSQAKLTDADVLEIRRMVAGGALQREAAERFDVAGTLISRIVNRRIWKHI